MCTPALKTRSQPPGPAGLGSPSALRITIFVLLPSIKAQGTQKSTVSKKNKAFSAKHGSA